MSKTLKVPPPVRQTLPKCPTGIAGLDDVTGGGLPCGRPTLVCGGPGCGKTLLAMEFLARGAAQFGEAGVCLTFEESSQELADNIRSLGIDLDALIEQKKLLIDYVHLERSEIVETGEYDLEGLFLRLGHAIDTISARRVVLDTIEALFVGLGDAGILRSELRRLFRWLKDRGVTAVITGERGEGMLTRHGLEEYVSDCVILLDHRVHEHLSTRLLRVVKYRGALHGTNEYPFLIDANGISVLPITSLGLDHEASPERVSTGIARLDAMLGGKGYYRGTTVLISGTAGTGKTSVAAHFADATCRRGERCLYFAFEESQSQLTRNMRSIGLDLEVWIKKGLLRFQAARPTGYGLEMHLVTMHKHIIDFDPRVVIIDPLSDFLSAGTIQEVKSMLVRLVDALKSRQITALFTSLTTTGDFLETSNVGITSVIDTWLFLRELEERGERNRGLFVLKSRGMAHSNQIREFALTDHGIELSDVYLGPDGVLAGSARLVEEARQKALVRSWELEIERHRRGLERKRKAIAAQVEVLQAELQANEDEVNQAIAQEEARLALLRQNRADMAENRRADGPAPSASSSRRKAK